MGYLFIAIALSAGATKGYCGKRTSGFAEGYKDAVLFNLVRMMFCIIIGLGVVIAEGSVKNIVPGAPALAITALSGVATSVFVVSWLVAVKKGSYMMLDVFLMLGTLVPLLLGKELFGEEIGFKSWIGFGVLLIAVIIMCSYNNSIKTKITPTSLMLLIAAGLANGFADFSQKLFVKTVPEAPISVFNFYTYVFSAITLIIFFFIFAATDKEKKKAERVDLRTVFGYIAVMSACLFINSYFKTVAALYLDSAKLYPLNQGMALVISLLMSSALFKEKLTVKAIIGVAVAFAGLLIMNVL